jgi:chromosome segregation ATPase
LTKGAIMNAMPEWVNGVAATAKLWHGTMDQALVYWPGALAALLTVTVCTTAAFLILDASRRTAGMPGWAYLQESVGAFTAQRDSMQRVVEGLLGERGDLADEVEALKRERLQFEGLRRERAREEEALADVRQRLASMAADRVKVEALRAEVEQLHAEHSALTQSVVGLREEQNEHQMTLERRRGRLDEFEDEIIKSKAARDALAAEVAQRKLESESYQRQAQQYRVAGDDAKKLLREAEDRLKEADKERDRVIGETRALQGQIGRLEAERREIEDKAVAAQAGRTKLAQENGRLEADRSTLWVEVLALQEKRNTANSDLGLIEARLRDLRHQRDALHGEIEMLRRVLGSMESKFEAPLSARAG